MTDGIVHALGIGFAIIGATALVLQSSSWSTSIYAAGLIAMLGFSAAYNVWPVSPRKWWLRRFDQSAIFVFIAATFTPLLAQLRWDGATVGLLVGVWVVAGFGVVLKVLWPGRFDRLSILLCFLLGGSCVLAYQSAVAALPTSALWLIAIGAALYSAGVIFHLWESLRFQNSIWHTFVLLAAACHYAAILNCATLAGT